MMHRSSQNWGAGAEIKLPAGAGAEITNSGSGSNSGSFLFFKDLKKFSGKKITAVEE
jgi:hypothetical protein